MAASPPAVTSAAWCALNLHRFKLPADLIIWLQDLCLCSTNLAISLTSCSCGRAEDRRPSQCSSEVDDLCRVAHFACELEVYPAVVTVIQMYACQQCHL